MSGRGLGLNGNAVAGFESRDGVGVDGEDGAGGFMAEVWSEVTIIGPMRPWVRKWMSDLERGKGS